MGGNIALPNKSKSNCCESSNKDQLKSQIFIKPSKVSTSATPPAKAELRTISEAVPSIQSSKQWLEV